MIPESYGLRHGSIWNSYLAQPKVIVSFRWRELRFLLLISSKNVIKAEIYCNLTDFYDTLHKHRARAPKAAESSRVESWTPLNTLMHIEWHFSIISKNLHAGTNFLSPSWVTSASNDLNCKDRWFPRLLSREALCQPSQPRDLSHRKLSSLS